MNILMQFLISLWLAHPAFAAMEFPPTLNTPAETAAYANRIRLEVPEVITSASHAIDPGGSSFDYSLEGLIAREQALIRDLRANDAYMALAAARPPLQNLIFRKIHTVQASGYGVSDAWTKLLNKSRVAHEDLANRIAIATPRSSTLIFSGLSRLLPRELRASLGKANLSDRWRAISSTLMGYNPQRLHQEFDISRFGNFANTWTLADLENLIVDVQQDELEIAIQLQHAFSERHSDSEPWFASNESIDETLELSGIFPLNPASENFVLTLGRRMAKQYMSETATRSEEVIERELLLRELPPYLAIYRGCVGSDCSTSHSFAMPYSPFERDWWVEDPETGKHYGYVSGNITIVDGRPCLYIRDITGPGIRVEDITTILSGFYLSKEIFGARQMTLATSGFAVQNHFAELSQALARFAGVRQVQQEFRDDWIRSRFLNRHGSTLTYDNVVQHSSARQIELSPHQLAPYKILKTGRDRQKKENVWEMLETAVKTANSSFLPSARKDVAVDGDALIQVLRNERGLSVADYIRAADQELEQFGIKMSSNLHRKHESVFLHGFLNAPDAFVGEDNAKQGVRYVQDLLWRSTEPEAALPFLQIHREIFAANASMTNLVQGLLEHRQPADEERLRVLFRADYPIDEFELNDSEVQWLLTTIQDPNVTIDYFTRAAHHKLPEITARNFIAHLDSIGLILRNDPQYDEVFAERAAELLWEFTAPLNNIGLYDEVVASLAQENNLKILVPLAALYLRDYSPLSDYGFQAFHTLTESAKGHRLTKEWRQRVRGVLNNLTPEQLTWLRSKAAELAPEADDPNSDCQTALTPPRR